MLDNKNIYKIAELYHYIPNKKGFFNSIRVFKPDISIFSNYNIKIPGILNFYNSQIQ